MNIPEGIEAEVYRREIGAVGRETKVEKKPMSKSGFNCLNKRSKPVEANEPTLLAMPIIDNKEPLRFVGELSEEIVFLSKLNLETGETNIKFKD